MRLDNQFNQRLDQLVMSVTGGNNSEFAKLVGANETSIRNYRANRSNPPLSTALAIVNKTNVNPTWLFCGEGDMFREGDTRRPVIQNATEGGTNINGDNNTTGGSQVLIDMLIKERDRLVKQNEALEDQVKELNERVLEFADRSLALMSTLKSVEEDMRQYQTKKKK